MRETERERERDRKREWKRRKKARHTIREKGKYWYRHTKERKKIFILTCANRRKEKRKTAR